MNGYIKQINILALLVSTRMCFKSNENSTEVKKGKNKTCGVAWWR